MEKRGNWQIGNFVQFSPGQAPPEDWAVIVRINGDSAEVLRGDNPTPVEAKLTEFHAVESDDFKAQIQAYYYRGFDNLPDTTNGWRLT